MLTAMERSFEHRAPDMVTQFTPQQDQYVVNTCAILEWLGKLAIDSALNYASGSLWGHLNMGGEHKLEPGDH